MDVFIVIGRGGPTERLLPIVAELRRLGVSADIDYADRSIKGQLTYAQRLGARAIVMYEGEESVIRRPGADDESVPTDELVARLSR